MQYSVYFFDGFIINDQNEKEQSVDRGFFCDEKGYTLENQEEIDSMEVGQIIKFCENGTLQFVERRF